VTAKPDGLGLAAGLVAKRDAKQVAQEKLAAQAVLAEAQRIIHGPRREAYGSPLESFQRIADLWTLTLCLEVPLTAEQVALCLIQLKVARAVAGHEGAGIQRDSVVDIAGYSGCLDLIAMERGGWKA
jgi:hypothetical protein